MVSMAGEIMCKLIFLGYDLTEGELSQESLVSGEIKNANYLMAALKKLGVDILPISINLSKNSQVINCIDKSNAKGVLRWWYESKLINEIINKNIEDGDVLYLTIPSYLPFLNISKNVKIVITAHGTYWPELLADLKYERSLLKKMLHLVNGFIQLNIDKLSFKKAHYLHSVSDFQINEMIKTYNSPKNKIVSIRNGTDFLNLSTKRDIDLIWVGRLAKKKNFELFVNFANEVKAKKVCVCTGNDYFAIDKNSKQLLKTIEKDSRYLIKHDISDSELNQLMNRSKCLVVSSTGYESIPTVIFEGIASGCYVLTPNSWGVNEVEGYGVIKYIEGSLESMVTEYQSINNTRNEIPHIFDSVKWENRAKQFMRSFEL